MRRRLSAPLLGVACCLAAVAYCAVVVAADTPSRAPAPAVLSAPTATPTGQPPPYDRSAFGTPWSDVDHNGCDTRSDVLALYLTQTVKRGACEIRSGTLVDPYTGVTEHFEVAVGYQPIQMDHVYSLAEAWRDGAWSWTPEQRLGYANDPSNLLPTSLNSAKSDHGPADLLRMGADPASKWKPSPAGACRFARTFALTAAEYRLRPPEPDAAALAAMLHSCPPLLD